MDREDALMIALALPFFIGMLAFGGTGAENPAIYIWVPLYFFIVIATMVISIKHERVAPLDYMNPESMIPVR